MKAIDIVELIKQTNPKILGKTPDEKTAKIIAAAFRQVTKQLNETTEGSVKIAGLGSFAIKQVEREKEGNKVTVKKVSFRAAKVKEKKGAAGQA